MSGAAAAGAIAIPRTAAAQLLPQQFSQQVTIAANVPLSGPMQSAGRQIVEGMQAAVDQTNMYGGRFGTAFAMRPFDDLDALAQTITNVQFAASDSTVVATVGGPDGSLDAAALGAYANSQMPLLIPASTADAITERGYRNVWRLPTKDSVEGQLFARFLAKRMKPKFALAITQDGDYGADVARGFRDQAQALGIASDIYIFPWQNPDYAAAARAALTKSPSYVYLCGETADLGPIIPALQAAGFTGTFGASEGFYNQSTLDRYGAAFAKGLVSTSFPPLELAPDVANALSDFRARTSVTAASAFAYAAAQIAMLASRRVQATNRLTMLSALQAPALYDTIVGPFQFGTNGDPIDPNLYFYTPEGAKFKFAGPSHPTPFIL